ncbi:uncharacterized protein LOC110116422 isoform X2 [Dendrobium catenatum]|uniref:uncharacterized protein LOC110116422 isoform X2 n=1 Tax=Dendrobium catenatum TaxID=906689 RepID=UPI0009F4C0D8|nr:uncharacterized protein LOC110116422 isoform X2 [Dendrobium catenatum]
MTKVQRKGETPTSLKAVKSFNSCAGNFFSTNTRERTKRIWVITERSDVHPDCKNATNPYHKCAEYCFKYIPNGEQRGQVMKLNNLEGEKIFSSCGRTSLQSQCMYASNPHDECTDFCFKNGPDSNTRDGENPMDDSTNSQESGALPKQLHVSIPCHNGFECFFENTPEQMLPEKAMNPKEEIQTSLASKSEVKLECLNANQYNIYDESCFHSQPEDQDLEAMTFAKDEKEVVPKPQREMNSNRENVSNPYVEYCFKNVPENDQLGLAATKSKEENKIALYRERLANPECQFTSNPYHTCAEYCFQKAPERERRGHVMTLRSIKKLLSIRETTNVHPQCKFASNPYHECDSDCFQNELDQNKARGVIMKPNKETKVVVPEEKGVNPKCQFASNPYHVCAEYFFQNFPEGKMRGHVVKLNNQQELKKAVSHRNISEGVIESKAGKKETSYELRREVNTKCKLVSNPFHKSSECCSEGYPDKNQPVKSIPVTTKEKNNRNSLSEKTHHPIMEKSTANLEFVEASKPIHNNVESFVAIIFPDQILKNSENSNLVEESNPDSDYTDFSDGITMEVVAKDLMGEVEMRITKETSDAQPMLLLASGLFLEWANYCSQENEAEDKIFMQVERKAFDTKNGQDNDSSNLAKVKSKSLQSSLPTYVLFFLGFLFARFKWTEVIHAVVMSSERKSSGRRMHKGLLNPNEKVCFIQASNVLNNASME